MPSETSTGEVLQRRQPVQKRSRLAVSRILDAAATLIEEEGVDAVSTRSVADLAGVSYPSLYRFFRDRDEILERLLERHIANLEGLGAALRPTWDFQTPADLLNAEFALHVGFYRDNPSAARLWMGGRASSSVEVLVHAQIRRIAQRMYQLLMEGGLLPVDTDPQALLVAIELGDRALELAYRGRSDFDARLLELGRQALVAYMDRITVMGSS